MTIYENQLLGYFLAPLGQRRLALVDAIGADGADALRYALASVLLEVAADRDNPFLTVEETERPAPPRFRSVVWRGGGLDEPATLYAFNFKEAFTGSGLSLLGLLVSLDGGALSLAAIPAGAELLRNLWSKLAVLREPEHADAICLLNAMAAARADLRLAGSSSGPRWDDVVTRSGLDREAARTALNLLRDKGIVEVSEWGGQAEAVDHPDNRWRVKF